MQTFTMISSTVMGFAICLFFLFWHDRRVGLVVALATKRDVFAGGNQVTCDNEGESITVPGLHNIKCFNCTCRNGFVKCILPKCTTSNEDFHDREILKNDECCPKIKGTGSYLRPSGDCLHGSNLHKSGSQFNLDNCTQCFCNNTQIYCKKKSCPIPDCRHGEQRAVPSQCCPHCSTVVNESVEFKPIFRPDKGEVNKDELLKYVNTTQQLSKTKTCVYAAEKYRNGESWNTTTCKTCTCMQGKINCSAMMCPAVKCHASSTKKFPGSCCPVCGGKLNPNRGVCTVFQGSHFRTFDGKTYAIAGSCKYQLTSDCDDSSFNVRLITTMLKNGARIKRVSLKLGTTRVDLQWNRNTKVNDEIVDLPYKLENQLNIAGNNEEVTVASTLGIKVHWSYVGLLDVTLPEKYRKKVCGLCGNFNGLADDDLTTREGILTDEAAIFAQSWAAGKEECLYTKNYGFEIHDTRKVQKACNYIKGSVFEKCLSTIFTTSYYKTCLVDCSSDNLQCHCRSFANYVRDCRMLKINITRWRKSVGC